MKRISIVILTICLCSSDTRGALVYSTFVGGGANDYGSEIISDGQQGLYVIGGTESEDFPVTEGALDGEYGGERDAWVARLRPDGRTFFYCTYLGGQDGDQGTAVCSDSAGGIFVGGLTESDDFPVTEGAFDDTLNIDGRNGGRDDAFVARLNEEGNRLIFSTYLGAWGWEACHDLILNGGRGVLVTGYSNAGTFPTTENAFDRTPNDNSDPFFAMLSEDGSELIWSTLFGGVSINHVYGACLNGERSIIVGGMTYRSEDFPITEGAFDETFNDGQDCWFARLDRDGRDLTYSSFLGGAGIDNIEDVISDDEGGAFLTGHSGSEEFPVTDGAFDPELNGGNDAFVTRISEDGDNLIFSTFIGGASGDAAFAICSDGEGGTVIAGTTSSDNFPVTGGAHDTEFNGETDVFVTRLSHDGNALLYGTYLGGRGTDYGSSICRDGTVLVAITGSTNSEDFPTTNGAFDRQYNGGERDAFIARLNVFVAGEPLPHWVEFPGEVITAYETDLIEFTVRGVGHEGQQLTIRFDRGDLPNAAEFSDNGDGTGVFHWQTVIGDRGPYSARITISDEIGEATAELNFAILPFPLEWVLLPDTVHHFAGDSISFEVAGVSREEGITPRVQPDPDMFPRNAVLLGHGDGSAILYWATVSPHDIGEHLVGFILTDGNRNLPGQIRIFLAERLNVSDFIPHPSSFILSEAFPNPFNSSTTIRFGLPVASEITVRVCDPSGKDIETLAEGNFGPGYHEVIWNASKMPAGLYIIQLETVAGRQFRKSLLVR